MLLSRSNLQVKDVASSDAFDAGMNALHVEEDGSTVASNGRMILAVGPVDRARTQFPDVGEETEPGPGGVGVRLETVNKTLKNMISTKGGGKAVTDYVAMTVPRKKGDVEFTITDTRNDMRISGRAKTERFPDWKAAVRGLSGDGVRVCLNRKDLIDLLTAMDKACPDKTGNSPVFVEVAHDGRGVTLRAVNHETTQHAVAAMNGYQTGEQWLPLDAWEQRVFARAAKRKRREEE